MKSDVQKVQLLPKLTFLLKTADTGDWRARGGRIGEKIAVSIMHKSG